ncbi:HEAT repeat domain-containing protein [Parapedobacter sp. 10938]|uniref:HEAT repeat domain-containing protein n=1 Tax=Parapedobacter flavus TaxID=3110225 RepID=UPI002DB88E19|nr:HEAT repeat domain-containing protein [Parapedobacter sp. 10938]MEC3879979.1 HEAT repeat domain-containing protein [Parapedobacter sp. 10938]
MNDPLKKFVQEHRAAFDREEPPEGVLQRLQAQLKPEPTVSTPIPQHPVSGRYRRATWLVAASLLIGLVCAYLFFDSGWTQRPDAPQIVHQPVEQAPITAEPPVTAQVGMPAESPEPPVAELRQKEPRNTTSRREPAQAPLAVRLADSSSASTRLAAILEIEQAGRMDEQLVAMLSETMNRDGNTNVRLAALDVLSSHLEDPQVADLLATALTHQDDPLVQLGIVRIAAQIDHVGIEEALFAVARSPYTFEAVKDEAYAVLLYQEKL